tara:strand:- start:406 stop:609 length:204 start_codon:yes stop_codon:yes gene_type:complete
LQLHKNLHKNSDYVDGGYIYAPLIKLLIEKYSIDSIADYGAGKCSLKKAIIDIGMSKIDYFPYNPAY